MVAWFEHQFTPLWTHGLNIHSPLHGLMVWTSIHPSMDSWFENQFTPYMDSWFEHEFTSLWSHGLNINSPLYGLMVWTSIHPKYGLMVRTSIHPSMNTWFEHQFIPLWTHGLNINSPLYGLMVWTSIHPIYGLSVHRCACWRVSYIQRLLKLIFEEVVLSKFNVRHMIHNEIRLFFLRCWYFRPKSSFIICNHYFIEVIFTNWAISLRIDYLPERLN